MKNRRDLFKAISAVGIGTLTFQKALANQIQTAKEQKANEPFKLSAEMIRQAEWVAGISLADEERETVANSLNRLMLAIQKARKVVLKNEVPPALIFRPLKSSAASNAPLKSILKPPEIQQLKKPEPAADLAFMPAYQLAHLLHTKQISSVELTKFYLDRLQKYDPMLKFVVSMTDDLAMKQAKQADEEIAAGKIRSPLHGVPWGAKDLIAVEGYKTTWGAAHFKDQQFNSTAIVAKKLEAAGMVLVAKLTLGALAWGDQWFGGMTRNPWDQKRGSSGSSAGSASAVAAGCVPVAVGSETLGSIVSPSRECGVTGLRPTFGRVDRTGCMALSWSMDKLGPLARSVDDCALMLGLMNGEYEGKRYDQMAVAMPFQWPGQKTLPQIKVGYVESNQPAIKNAAKSLEEMGVQLIKIKLPKTVLDETVSVILGCEAAAAFDELTRAGIKDGIGLWPTTFRESCFISAVDYIRVNRIRSLVMQEMEKAIEDVDVYLSGNDLAITNLTGHPSICLPAGMQKNGEAQRPVNITLSSQLFAESDLLTVAKAFQDHTKHHLQRPDLSLLKPL